MPRRVCGSPSQRAAHRAATPLGCRPSGPGIGAGRRRVASVAGPLTPARRTTGRESSRVCPQFVTLVASSPGGASIDPVEAHDSVENEKGGRGARDGSNWSWMCRAVGSGGEGGCRRWASPFWVADLLGWCAFCPAPAAVPFAAATLTRRVAPLIAHSAHRLAAN